MNGKQAKKLRQLYGREIRGSFNIWQETVNDKPRWMPKFVWAWILGMVFKKDAVQILEGIKNT